MIEVLGPYDFPEIWQDSDNDVESDSANFFTVLGAIGLIVYLGIDYIPVFDSKVKLLLIHYRKT